MPSKIIAIRKWWIIDKTLDDKIWDDKNPSLSIGKIIDGDGQEHIQ